MLSLYDVLPPGGPRKRPHHYLVMDEHRSSHRMNQDHQDSPMATKSLQSPTPPTALSKPPSAPSAVSSSHSREGRVTLPVIEALRPSSASYVPSRPEATHLASDLSSPSQELYNERRNEATSLQGGRTDGSDDTPTAQRPYLGQPASTAPDSTPHSRWQSTGQYEGSHPRHYSSASANAPMMSPQHAARIPHPSGHMMSPSYNTPSRSAYPTPTEPRVAHSQQGASDFAHTTPAGARPIPRQSSYQSYAQDPYARSENPYATNDEEVRQQREHYWQQQQRMAHGPPPYPSPAMRAGEQAAASPVPTDAAKSQGGYYQAPSPQNAPYPPPASYHRPQDPYSGRPQEPYHRPPQERVDERARERPMGADPNAHLEESRQFARHLAAEQAQRFARSSDMRSEQRGYPPQEAHHASRATHHPASYPSFYQEAGNFPSASHFSAGRSHHEANPPHPLQQVHSQRDKIEKPQVAPTAVHRRFPPPPAPTAYGPMQSSSVSIRPIAGAIPGRSYGKDEAPVEHEKQVRESHKLAERRRRREMKGLFDELRLSLPIEPSIRLSKWDVLNRAIYQLRHLEMNTQRYIEAVQSCHAKLGLPPFQPFSIPPFATSTPDGGQMRLESVEAPSLEGGDDSAGESRADQTVHEDSSTDDEDLVDSARQAVARASRKATPTVTLRLLQSGASRQPTPEGQQEKKRSREQESVTASSKANALLSSVAAVVAAEANQPTSSRALSLAHRTLRAQSDPPFSRKEQPMALSSPFSANRQEAKRFKVFADQPNEPSTAAAESNMDPAPLAK